MHWAECATLNDALLHIHKRHFSTLLPQAAGSAATVCIELFELEMVHPLASSA